MRAPIKRALPTLTMKKGIWRYTGTRYQGAAEDLVVLFDAAIGRGELTDVIEINALPQEASLS